MTNWIGDICDKDSPMDSIVLEDDLAEILPIVMRHGRGWLGIDWGTTDNNSTRVEAAMRIDIE